MEVGLRVAPVSASPAPSLLSVSSIIAWPESLRNHTFIGPARHYRCRRSSAATKKARSKQSSDSDNVQVDVIELLAYRHASLSVVRVQNPILSTPHPQVPNLVESCNLRAWDKFLHAEHARDVRIVATASLTGVPDGNVGENMRRACSVLVYSTTRASSSRSKKHPSRSADVATPQDPSESVQIIWKENSLHCAAVSWGGVSAEEGINELGDAASYQVERLKDVERQMSIEPLRTDIRSGDSDGYQSLDDCVTEWMSHNADSRHCVSFSCSHAQVEARRDDEAVVVLLFFHAVSDGGRSAGGADSGNTTYTTNLVVIGRFKWDASRANRGLFGKQPQRAQVVGSWQCAPVRLPVFAHVACMECSSTGRAVEIVAWYEEEERITSDTSETLPSTMDALARFHVGSGDGEAQHMRASSSGAVASRISIARCSVRVSQDRSKNNYSNPFALSLLCCSDLYRIPPGRSATLTSNERVGFGDTRRNYPSWRRPCGAVLKGTLVVPVYSRSGDHAVLHIPIGHIRKWSDASLASPRHKTGDAIPTSIAAYVSTLPRKNSASDGVESDFCKAVATVSASLPNSSGAAHRDRDTASQRVLLLATSHGHLVGSAPLRDAVDALNDVKLGSQGWRALISNIHAQTGHMQTPAFDASSTANFVPVHERRSDGIDFAVLFVTCEGCVVLQLVPCETVGVCTDAKTSAAANIRERVSWGDPALDLIWHLVSTALAEGERERSSVDNHRDRLTSLFHIFFQQVAPALRFSGSPTREAFLLLRGIQRVLATATDGAAVVEGQQDRHAVEESVELVREVLLRVRDDLQRQRSESSSSHGTDDSVVQLLRILADGMQRELHPIDGTRCVSASVNSTAVPVRATGVFEAAVLVALADHRVDLIALAEETIPQMVACQLAPPTTWVVEARENSSNLVHAIATVLLCACFDVTVFVSADGLFRCYNRCGNVVDSNDGAYEEEGFDEADVAQSVAADGVYVRRAPQTFASQAHWERAAALSADLLSLTSRDNLNFPLTLAAFSLLGTKRYHAFRTLVEMYPVHFSQYWDSYLESVSALDSLAERGGDSRNMEGAEQCEQDGDMKWLTTCSSHVDAAPQHVVQNLIGGGANTATLADVLANALHTTATMTNTNNDGFSPPRTAHLFDVVAAHQLALCVPRVFLAASVTAFLHWMTECVVAAQNNYAVSVMKAYLSAEVVSGVEQGDLVSVEHRLQRNIPAPYGGDGGNSTASVGLVAGPSPNLLQCEVCWSRLVGVLSDARTAWTRAAPFLPCSLDDLEMLIVDLKVRTARDHGGLPQTLVAAMLCFRLVILCTFGAQLQMQVIAALRSQLQYTYSAERDGPAETSPPVATCIIALRAMYMLRGTVVPTLWFQDQVLSAAQLLIPLATQFSAVAAIACRVLSLSLAAVSDHAPLKKRCYAIESVVRPLRKESAVPFMVESLLEDATKWAPSVRENEKDPEDDVESHQVNTLLDRLQWVQTHQFPRREFMINTSWTHVLWPVESTPMELEHAFEDIRPRPDAVSESEPSSPLSGALARPLFDAVCSVMTQHEPRLIASAADDPDSFFRDPAARNRRQKRGDEEDNDEGSADSTNDDDSYRSGTSKPRPTALTPTNPPSPNRELHAAALEAAQPVALTTITPSSQTGVDALSLPQRKVDINRQVSFHHSAATRETPPRHADDEAPTSPIFDPSVIAWWERLADGDDEHAEGGGEALAVTSEARRQLNALRRTADGLGNDEDSDGSSTDEGTEGKIETSNDSSSRSSADKSDTSSRFCHRHLKHHHRCERHRCHCACHACHRDGMGNFVGHTRSAMNTHPQLGESTTAQQQREEPVVPPQLLRLNGLATSGSLLVPTAHESSRATAYWQQQQQHQHQQHQGPIPTPLHPQARAPIPWSPSVCASPVPGAQERTFLTLPPGKMQPNARVCLWVAALNADGTPNLKGVYGNSPVMAPWCHRDGEAHDHVGELRPPPLPASSVFPQPLTMLTFRGTIENTLSSKVGTHGTASSQQPNATGSGSFPLQDGTVVDRGELRSGLRTEETHRMYTELENELPVSMEVSNASRPAEDPFFKSFISGFGAVNNARLFSADGKPGPGGDGLTTTSSAPQFSGDDAVDSPALSPSQKVAFRHYVNELLARQDGSQPQHGNAGGSSTDQILSVLQQQRFVSRTTGVALSEPQQEFMRVLTTQQQAFFQVVRDGYEQQKRASERIFKSAVADAFAEAERCSALSNVGRIAKDAADQSRVESSPPTGSAVYDHAHILNEALEHRNRIARMNDRLLGLQSIAVDQLAADAAARFALPTVAALEVGRDRNALTTEKKQMVSHETYALSDNDDDPGPVGQQVQGMTQRAPMTPAVVPTASITTSSTPHLVPPVQKYTWTTTAQSAVDDATSVPAGFSSIGFPETAPPPPPSAQQSGTGMEGTAAELHRLSNALTHISGSVDDMEKALAASQDVLSRYDYSRELGAVSTTVEQELALRSLRLRSTALEQELRDVRCKSQIGTAADPSQAPWYGASADPSRRGVNAATQAGTLLESLPPSAGQRELPEAQLENQQREGSVSSPTAGKKKSVDYSKLHMFTRSHVESAVDEIAPHTVPSFSLFPREGVQSRGDGGSAPIQSPHNYRRSEGGFDGAIQASEEQMPAQPGVRFSGVTRVDVLPNDDAYDTDPAISSAPYVRSLHASASLLSDSSVNSFRVPRVRQQTLPPSATTASKRKTSVVRPVALHGLQDVYDNPSALTMSAIPVRDSTHSKVIKYPNRVPEKRSPQTQRAPPSSLQRKSTTQLRQRSPVASTARNRFDMYRAPVQNARSPISMKGTKSSAAAEQKSGGWVGDGGSGVVASPRTKIPPSNANDPSRDSVPFSAVGDRRSGAGRTSTTRGDAMSAKRNDERTRSLIHQLTSLQAAFDDAHV